jgi:hypothetical protein
MNTIQVICRENDVIKTQYSRFRFYIDIYYINEEYSYINVGVRGVKL